MRTLKEGIRVLTSMAKRRGYVFHPDFLQEAKECDKGLHTRMVKVIEAMHELDAYVLSRSEKV